MNSDPEKLVQRIEETLLAYCRQQGLFKSGDRVIAACSGGADSMALLLFLLRRRRDLKIEVLATHVNHGIRGLQAQADANFVRAFCSSQGVELFVYDAVREGVQIPRTPVKNGRAGFGTGGSTGWRPRRRLPSLQHIRFRTRRKLCCSAWPAEQASTAWRGSRRAAVTMCAPSCA